jgi:predicted RNA-binding Zn-ribbon protein involved in translation (DUF1610 family)
MPICERCGAKVSENARFCEQCGLKLNEAAIKTPEPEHACQDKIVKDNSTVEHPEQPKEIAEPEIEELDLTTLDKKAKSGEVPDEQPPSTGATEPQAGGTPAGDHVPAEEPSKKSDNIINLGEILESEEKKELDTSIKREVLADDEVFSKICPMCGEEMQINKQLLANTPVLVKCLKCGNETKIW